MELLDRDPFVRDSFIGIFAVNQVNEDIRQTLFIVSWELSDYMLLREKFENAVFSFDGREVLRDRAPSNLDRIFILDVWELDTVK